MRLLLKLPLVARLYYSMAPHSFLSEVGWAKSCQAALPLDRDGKPIPWITYPCLDFLRERWDCSWSVLEFGAGYSTLWFSERSSRCCSLETDQAWARRIKAITAERPNVQIHNFAKITDINGILGGARFDVIFIDGSTDRRQAFLASLRHLKDNGVIVWDNSDREEYTLAKEDVRKNDFKAIDFSGPVPCSIIKSRTSIIYRRENVLGI